MLTVGARPKRPAKRHAAVLMHTICGTMNARGIRNQSRCNTGDERRSRSLLSALFFFEENGEANRAIFSLVNRSCSLPSQKKKTMKKKAGGKLYGDVRAGRGTHGVLGGAEGPVSLDAHITLDGGSLRWDDTIGISSRVSRRSNTTDSSSVTAEKMYRFSVKTAKMERSTVRR